MATEDVDARHAANVAKTAEVAETQLQTYRDKLAGPMSTHKQTLGQIITCPQAVTDFLALCGGSKQVKKPWWCFLAYYDEGEEYRQVCQPRGHLRRNRPPHPHS